MSMPGMGVDKVGVLIESLSVNQERFETSNLYLQKKGLTAIFEIEKLESELFDFAKDPSIKEDDLGIPRPQQPTVKSMEGLSEEEQIEKIEVYRKLMKEYNLAVTSLRMQVPIADMFAIEQYIKPFRTTIHATPAVKGRRFHAFTKNVEEPNNGLFGMRQAKNASS